MEVTTFKIKHMPGLTIEETMRQAQRSENRELIGVAERADVLRKEEHTEDRPCGGCGGGKVR